MAKVKGARINWADIGWVSFNAMSGHLIAAAEAAGTVASLFALHSKWIDNKREFAESVGRDFEMIPVLEGTDGSR